MPIYRATVKVNGEEQVRLVEAKTEAGALKHVTEKHVAIETVRTAEQMKAMAALAAKGVEVEVAE